MKQGTHSTAGGDRGWRMVDGVLLLDKGPGITSSATVQRVRRLFRARKAGHTGTLDPMATGLLPVCLGEATKFSHVLLDADKSYVATIRLGVTTSTGDLEGEVTGRHEVRSGRESIEHALKGLTGEIEQTPPMYSALKRGGQPLYKLARAGANVPRAPRRVVVHALDVLGLEGDELRIGVRCSKGTYVRVLAEDLGRALGCGACLSGLRREGVGSFRLSSGAITLERVEETAPEDRDALLLSPDVLVTGLPRLDLDSRAASRLSQGQPVATGVVPPAGLARIYGPGGIFLGVAEVKSHGEIVPRRLVASASPRPATGQVSLEKPRVRE
jgi:tRNA pseudouridine55 synthase